MNKLEGIVQSTEPLVKCVKKHASECGMGKIQNMNNLNAKQKQKVDTCIQAKCKTQFKNAKNGMKKVDAKTKRKLNKSAAHMKKMKDCINRAGCKNKKGLNLNKCIRSECQTLLDEFVKEMNTMISKIPPTRSKTQKKKSTSKKR